MNAAYRWTYFAAMTAEIALDSSPDELPLLEAKLARPRLRAGVIPRARLFDTLDLCEQLARTLARQRHPVAPDDVSGELC